MSEARFSMLHIDADAYDSILDVLEATYPRLAPGGYVVVDDLHLYGVREALGASGATTASAAALPVPLDYASSRGGGATSPSRCRWAGKRRRRARQRCFRRSSGGREAVGVAVPLGEALHGGVLGERPLQRGGPPWA